MKKRLKRNYVFRFILFFIFIALIAAIVFGNFFVAPYITNITTADSIRYPDKKIVNVEVENYFFKFNKTTWCLLVETNGVPNVNDSGWVKANNGYCSFITDLSSYDVYVKDSYGNISDVDKRKQKEKNIKKIPMSNENIYLYPTQQQKVNVNDENIQTVQWKSDDEKIATVDNNGIISGISAGTTTIKAIYKENYYGEVKVIVTNLIEKPDASAKKEYVKCRQFSDDEAQLLDDILEEKIKEAGYQTRAGVVAAARFLTLDFSYRVPYFYENGRLENYEPYQYVDGEGRYYHKGLYLSTKKIKDLKANFVGPAIWGCNLQNYTDWNGVYVTGQLYPNGLDCSGFVTWALLNGGFDVGDIGAGTDPAHKDLTDLGQKVYITEELMASGKVKVGDLIGLDGHMAILAGWDSQNYYIAESLNTTGGVVMTTVARTKLVNNSIYRYIILMDEVYKTDGNLTNMW
mgnify:FL=1